MSAKGRRNGGQGGNRRPARATIQVEGQGIYGYQTDVNHISVTRSDRDAAGNDRRSPTAESRQPIPASLQEASNQRNSTSSFTNQDTQEYNMLLWVWCQGKHGETFGKIKKEFDLDIDVSEKYASVKGQKVNPRDQIINVTMATGTGLARPGYAPTDAASAINQVVHKYKDVLLHPLEIEEQFLPAAQEIFRTSQGDTFLCASPSGKWLMVGLDSGKLSKLYGQIVHLSAGSRGSGSADAGAADLSTVRAPAATTDESTSLTVDRYVWRYVRNYHQDEYRRATSGLKPENLKEKNTPDSKLTLINVNSPKGGSGINAEDRLESLVYKYKEITSCKTVACSLTMEQQLTLDGKLAQMKGCLAERDGAVIHIVALKDKMTSAIQMVKDLLTEVTKVRVVSKTKQAYGSGAIPSGQNASDNLPPKSFSWKDETFIHVFTADVTKLYVNVMVNAAAPDLQMKVGVSAAVAEAAGSQIERACADVMVRRRNAPLRVTETCTTSGYNLPCKFVLHAVGPSKETYTNKEECITAMYQTFANCLQAAEKKGLESIAIPAISTGIYGLMTVSAVARQLYLAVRDHLTNNLTSTLANILLVDADQQFLKHLQHEFVMGCDKIDLTLLKSEDGNADVYQFHS